MKTTLVTKPTITLLWSKP